LCLITAQCPTATRVAGFQTWPTMRRVVRKGEKGIAILAPIVGRRQPDAADDDSKTVLGFRAAYVFDIASTEGEPLPEIAVAAGDPGTKTDALCSAIRDQGIVIETADHLGGALGTSAGERIQILNGLSPADTFLVLAHEYAHCLLHRADDRPASRDTREREAEAVAFVVGDAVGLNARQSSRDYLHLYNGDREGLAQSLDRIQRAASVILSAVEAGSCAMMSFAPAAG
jgi:hypothetical protein